MVRDADWWDDVGKDLWRWEQELKELEKKNEIPQTSSVPEVREQRQSG